MPTEPAQTTLEIPQNATPPAPPESPGEIGAPAENSFLQKVRDAAQGIFERHGVTFKAGRGRPRKDGLPKASDIPLNAPTTALPAGVASLSPLAADAAPAFDSALVRRCVSAVVKAVRGFLDKKLWRKAMDATRDAKFAGELVKETTITQDELDGLSELTEICLRKYGVGSEYAPEIGLIAIAAGVGVRYAVALQTLEAKLNEQSQTQAN